MNRHLRPVAFFLPAALTFIACLVASASQATQPVVDEPNDSVAKRKGVVVKFHEEITPLSGALLKRRFAQAVESGADVVILDIDSPGGYLSTTLELVKMIEQAEGIETVAFIEREAISGAAIIALATDRIVMLPLARIGDAGMIVLGEDAAFRYAPEKARSLLAQQLRDIATRTGRPPALAEAMVDKDLIVFRGKRIDDDTTRLFTNREWDALENPAEWEKGAVIREAGGNVFFIANGERSVELAVAELNVKNRGELAAALGLIEPIPVLEATWTDTLVWGLNLPAVTAVLLLIGMIALVVELGTAGMGLGGLLSIFCFGLFFWSRFLGGTSGWLEVMLFAIGISFLLLEIFVIPGTGVAGVSGTGLVLFSLVMASRRVAMPESARDLSSLTIDIFTVFAAFIGFLVALFVLTNYLGDLPGLSRLTLAPPSDDESAPPVASLAGEAAALSAGLDAIVIGDVGRSLGPLRPSGKMQLGDSIVDVVSEGDFIEDGQSVRVIAKLGPKITVRRA